ncbi:MAG: hypothetical protein ACI4UE_06910 [Candidatus Scatovivens sp.]
MTRKLRVFFNKILRNKKYKILFFSTIILICIAVICIGIYIQFFYKYSETDPLMIGINIGSKKTNEYYNNLRNEFNSIFNSELLTEEPNTRLDKIQTNKETVYTGYNLKNEDENFYQIDIKVPILNINTEVAKKINEEIKSEFYDKANTIMRQMDGYTVYSVSYCAYINKDIVSIAIKSSLKEEGKNEKVSIKTYNYNIPGSKEVSLNELIDLKQITKKDVQNNIDEEIKKAYNNALAISEQYGTTYNRKLNDEMYKIDNTKVFFLTNEGNVYIVYPYGNTEYTNEMDIVIF